MAKIVELIGSPGVGKSTIYSEIVARWKSSCNWVPSEDLYPREKLELKNYQKLFLNTARVIIKKKAKIDSAALKEAGARFLKLYPEYADACWNDIISTPNKNLDLRFERVAYLYQLIQKIQSVRENNSNKIAIVDEGLVHRITCGLYTNRSLAEEEKEINEVLQTMPLPVGIVHIETDLQENVRRLLQRKKVISMHKSLIVPELETVTRLDREKRALFSTILESKPVKFLRIDSTNAVEDNVAKIISFVESL